MHGVRDMVASQTNFIHAMSKQACNAPTTLIFCLTSYLFAGRACHALTSNHFRVHCLRLSTFTLSCINPSPHCNFNNVRRPCACSSAVEAVSTYVYQWGATQKGFIVW